MKEQQRKKDAPVAGRLGNGLGRIPECYDSRDENGRCRKRKGGPILDVARYDMCEKSIDLLKVLLTCDHRLIRVVLRSRDTMPLHEQLSFELEEKPDEERGRQPCERQERGESIAEVDGTEIEQVGRPQAPRLHKNSLDRIQEDSASSQDGDHAHQAYRPPRDTSPRPHPGRHRQHAEEEGGNHVARAQCEPFQQTDVLTNDDRSRMSSREMLQNQRAAGHGAQHRGGKREQRARLSGRWRQVRLPNNEKPQTKNENEKEKDGQVAVIARRYLHSWLRLGGMERSLQLRSAMRA